MPEQTPQKPNDEWHKPEYVVAVSAVALGIGGFAAEQVFVFERGQARHASHEVSYLNQEITGYKQAEQALATGPNYQAAEQALQQKAAAAQAEATAIRAHSPVFAGGQAAEDAGLFFGEIIFLPILAGVATFRARRAIRRWMGKSVVEANEPSEPVKEPEELENQA